MKILSKDQILEKEKSLALEMKTYYVQHQIDKGSNYYYSEQTNDSELASYIFNTYKNLDTTNDYELATLVIKCLTPIQIKNLLLEYELKNFKQDTIKEMTMDEFIKEAKFLLNRYQGKAGGFSLEDSEWKMYTSDSMLEETHSKHYIKDNEILFVNSVDNCDLNDDKLENYLDLLVDRLNSLANNIKAEIRYDESSGTKPSWLYLWIKISKS